MMQAIVKHSRMDDEIVITVAISVVVETVAQFLQFSKSRCFNTRSSSQCTSLFSEIVAECSDHRPRSLAPMQEPIDQHAGTYARPRIDERMQSRVNRQLAGVVMIEILNSHALSKQGFKCDPVAIQRDIQHGNPVARTGLHTL
jgi:hypothetical protein